MEKFKVGVWSVGVACSIVGAGATIAAVFTQDDNILNQLHQLIVLCGVGGMILLTSHTGIQWAQERRAEVLAQIKKDSEWYNARQALRQAERERRDAEWSAKFGHLYRK